MWVWKRGCGWSHEHSEKQYRAVFSAIALGLCYSLGFLADLVSAAASYGGSFTELELP